MPLNSASWRQSSSPSKLAKPRCSILHLDGQDLPDIALAEQALQRGRCGTCPTTARAGTPDSEWCRRSREHDLALRPHRSPCAPDIERAGRHRAPRGDRVGMYGQVPISTASTARAASSSSQFAQVECRARGGRAAARLERAVRHGDDLDARLPAQAWHDGSTMPPAPTMPTRIGSRTAPRPMRPHLRGASARGRDGQRGRRQELRAAQARPESDSSLIFSSPIEGLAAHDTPIFAPCRARRSSTMWR